MGLGLVVSVQGVLSVQVSKWYDINAGNHLIPQKAVSFSGSGPMQGNREPRFTLSRQQDMAWLAVYAEAYLAYNFNLFGLPFWLSRIQLNCFCLFYWGREEELFEDSCSFGGSTSKVTEGLLDVESLEVRGTFPTGDIW